MRILLFGDNFGLPQLLRHLQSDVLVGIVGASIRPHYIDELKVIARLLGIQFLAQPKWKSDRYSSFVQDVRLLAPDLILVNSYSMILRHDLLACARLGGVNIHPSLLPRNRGCNPIQWAILNGDSETGVTLHEIDSGLDTGPIIDQQRVPIFFEDSWLDVHHRIEQATDALIKKNVPILLSENWSSIPQMSTQATVGRRRIPIDGQFSWSQPMVEIYNKVRALLPPLPPAFYQNKAGQRSSLNSYQSIWQLILLRHQLREGWSMQAENVALRPLQSTDANLLYDLATYRNLCINHSPLFPVSETDHEAWIYWLMTSRSDLVVFVIEEIASGHVIGTCQLFNINWIHRSAELQIRIDQSEFQWFGYGRLAVNLLCRFGFNDLILHRIYFHVFLSDQIAIRLFQQCGFESEGTQKEPVSFAGSLLDVVLMAKLSHL